MKNKKLLAGDPCGCPAGRRPKGKEDFRKKVQIAAQRMIAHGEVQEALFVDFVIQ
jgi:hypothetical protein